MPLSPELRSSNGSLEYFLSTVHTALIAITALSKGTVQVVVVLVHKQKPSGLSQFGSSTGPRLDSMECTPVLLHAS